MSDAPESRTVPNNCFPIRFSWPTYCGISVQ